jgi:hypothetical protein
MHLVTPQPPAAEAADNQPTRSTTKLAFSIDQYCEASSLSRRTLYTLWEQGKGPPRIRVLGRVLIPTEGGAAWLLEQQ